MFGIWILDLLFFGTPVALLALWGVTLYRYFKAKKQHAANPEQMAIAELKKRKLYLILTSVVAGVIVSVTVGFMVLLFLAIAFM